MNFINVSFLVYFLVHIVFLFSNQSILTAAQEPIFELPVELVGFPVIIVAVRLSNFVKKLAYSLNPRTYVSNKTKRSVTNEEMINMVEAEKRLVTELGENVCIYPKVCLYQADKARRNSNRNREVQVDWNEVFNNYKTSKEKQKEFYFLSVFLGDFIASPKFCNHLVKLGRSCKD